MNKSNCSIQPVGDIWNWLFIVLFTALWPGASHAVGAGSDTIANGTFTKNDAALIEILKPIWKPFNEKHGLHADQMLTGMYFDGELTRQVAHQLIQASQDKQITWRQFDLIDMPGHDYFWRAPLTSNVLKVSITSAPQAFLKSILPSKRNNQRAMIHVRSKSDSLPSILIFKGKYKGWCWQNKRHWYVMILAFYAKRSGPEFQYQILDISPKFWDKYLMVLLKSLDYERQAYFPAGYYGHLPLYISRPSLYPPTEEPTKIVHMQMQAQRDSLYQWVVVGAHPVVSEVFHSTIRQALNLPENLYRETSQTREKRLRSGLKPQRWQVTSAAYRTRPDWMGAEYFFTLQSGNNPAEQYSVEFYLFHPPEPGQFQGAKMRMRSFRQVDE